MSDVVPEWYENKRKFLVDAYDIGTNISDRGFESSREHYTLTVVPFEFSDSHWYYSKAIVFKKDIIPIVSIIRNYGNFPFEWVLRHPKKRKYLVCSEDTHGMSVVDLISGKIHTHIDDNDDFWPRIYKANKDGSILAVTGSKLGELDKIRFYDFSNPIRLPWKLLAEFDAAFISNETEKNVYMSNVIGWDKKENALRVSCDTILDDGIRIDDFLLYPDGVYDHVDTEFLDV